MKKDTKLLLILASVLLVIVVILFCILSGFDLSNFSIRTGVHI